MIAILKMEMPNNRLRGPIPHALGSMAALWSFDVNGNSLRGPIPQAFGVMAALSRLAATGNRLCGPIPSALGSMTALFGLYMQMNSLRGPIPDVVSSMIALTHLAMNYNMLRGFIPHAIGSLTAMTAFLVGQSSLCGPIPHAVGSMTALMTINVAENSLRGPIPHCIGSMTAVEHLAFHYNDLRGTLPHALGCIPNLSFEANGNSFSGTIPVAVTCAYKNPTHIPIFAASDSQLSGSIPDGIMTYRTVLVHGNRLTGTLPVFRDVRLLLASGNLFEGILPSTLSSELIMLGLSGVPGRSGGLNGPLPSALRQSSELQMLTLAYQQMDGVIPSFTSTLSLLALHKNRLKVLPDIHLADDVALKTAILLHDNLLSCYVPACGNVTVKTSIVAIGNRLRYPKRQFPAWVLKHEHDPLFWVAGTDGMSLVQTISVAVGVFMCAVASRIGKGGLLRAMSRWQIGPPAHLWVATALSHLHARMMMECCVAAVFFMSLLSWDLYACPQTLVLVSACLRGSGLIQPCMLLWSCNLSFHSLAARYLTMQSKNEKKWPAKMLKNRLLLWLLWCALTVVVSTLPIFYQVCKSTPGFLQAGKISSLVLKAIIGSVQGLVANVIVPYLASKIRWHKHVLTAVSQPSHGLLDSCSSHHLP